MGLVGVLGSTGLACAELETDVVAVSECIPHQLITLDINCTETSIRRVRDVSYDKTKDLLILVFDRLATVTCTACTEFLMNDKTAKRACDLKYGDILYTTDDTVVKLREFNFYYGDAKPMFTVNTCDDKRPGSEYPWIQLFNKIYVRIGY